MQDVSNKKPVIGITCGEIFNKEEAWSPIIFGQSCTYIDSIIQAGGVPVLLPLTTDESLLGQLFDMIDGICMAGGNDIHPNQYGQQPDGPGDYSQLRDTTENFLLARALDKRLPILAICRGMQLLNIHFGGTLYQDIAKAKPDALDHNASTKLKTLVDLSHELHLLPESKLAAILGGISIGTNAHHHQAIDTLGNGIKATAWTKDTIIEAIELNDYPFAVGIQAHPESLTEVEPRWKNLFKTFVAASAQK